MFPGAMLKTTGTREGLREKLAGEHSSALTCPRAEGRCELHSLSSEGRRPVLETGQEEAGMPRQEVTLSSRTHIHLRGRRQTGLHPF